MLNIPITGLDSELLEEEQSPLLTRKLRINKSQPHIRFKSIKSSDNAIQINNLRKSKINHTSKRKYQYLWQSMSDRTVWMRRNRPADQTFRQPSKRLRGSRIPRDLRRTRKKTTKQGLDLDWIEAQ